MGLSLAQRLNRLAEGPPVPDDVRAEVARLLYPPSFRIGTSFLTAIANGIILAATMHSWLPVAWMVVALAFCLHRTHDWLSYRRRPERQSPAAWVRGFTLKILPFGIWWGMTAILLFFTDDPIVMAIAVLAIDAQSAGAVCSYPGHPPAALAFVVPAMTMVAVAGMIHGGEMGWLITFVELVLIANYLVIIREFYRTTLGALTARHEKATLADNLLEAHAALQREGSAKSEFLAHMSHELRTPLNAIMGFAEAMQGQYFGRFDNPKYLEYLGDIHSSADHLLHIVSDVLDVARVEAGALTLQIEEVCPGDITAFAARLVAQRANAKRLNLDIRLDPDLAQRRMMTDAVKLKQVLINLLSNAIKFTDAGGTVSLNVGAAPDAAVFEVADTGIGMTPEDLERAMIPFARVGDPHLSREGTGLGLSLSRKLIERLGGDFRIASDAGIGTRVTITMPCLV